jgi:hypothetical protein
VKDRSMNSSPPQIPVQPAPFEYDLPNLADAIEAAGGVRIVALGSSTTAGEGGIVAYPYRLEAALRDKYANPRIDVINRGVAGEEAPKERHRSRRDRRDAEAGNMADGHQRGLAKQAGQSAFA